MRNNKFKSGKNLIPAIANLVLVTNAFVWYFLIIGLLDSSVTAAQPDPSTKLLIWSLHFGGICISALAGALLSKKIKNKVHFIYYWMLIGVLLSVISMFFDLAIISNLLVFSVLFGVSLGSGMSVCMGYFANTIPVEKRGRIGGLIFLLTGLFIVVLQIMFGDNARLKEITITLWRFFGLVVFFFLLKLWITKQEFIKKETGATLNTQIFGQRAFLLYFIPWLMFSLITNLTIPMQNNIILNMPNFQTPESLRAIENIFVAGSAVIAGFLIDYIGRKRMSIFAFAMLGLGYASLGVQTTNPISWYFYTVADGVALGIFYTIFVITIWADFGTGSSREKYYAIGVLPFFISNFLRFTIGIDLSNFILENAIFSFVAFFLFLAVLPLANAPETLPEKTMKDRELKNYLDKAQKLVQKENKKKAEEEPEKKEPKEKEEEKTEPDKDEKSENSKEYDEAKRLAEKYY
jgi:MFS family permease